MMEKRLIFFFFLISSLIFLPSHTQAERVIDLSTAIVEVAKKAIPAVVHIEVTERKEVPNPFLPFQTDPFFRRFFGLPNMPKKFKQEIKGVGSGIIIDRTGRILSNYHVVGGAEKIEVLLSDGRKFEGKLIGTDQKTDLAVIKISSDTSLPFLRFSKVEVGEWVVAIGHPRGLDQTVTHGIISAKHRRGILDPSTYQDFLQTDAATNPGNSGGPLLNLKGEVIGVNAAIATESGGFEGIGFAIPSNMAMHVAKSLIAHGKVERGWIGVTVQDIEQETANSLGIKSRKGALVVEVIRGGPAEKAGIKKNDIVLFYDGREIEDSEDLRNKVASTNPGSSVKVRILRNGKEEEVTLNVLGTDEALKLLERLVKERLGAELRQVDEKDAERYGLQDTRALIILSTEPKGPFAQAGLEAKDLILAYDGQAVSDLEGFVQYVASLPLAKRVTLLALDHRTGNMGYVDVTLR